MIKSETLITTDRNGLTGQFLAKTDRTNQRIRKRPKTDITGYRREDSYLFPNQALARVPFTYSSSPSENLEQANCNQKKDQATRPPNALMNSINEILKLSFKLINAKDNLMSQC